MGDREKKKNRIKMPIEISYFFAILSVALEFTFLKLEKCKKKFFWKTGPFFPGGPNAPPPPVMASKLVIQAVMVFLVVA